MLGSSSSGNRAKSPPRATSKKPASLGVSPMFRPITRHPTSGNNKWSQAVLHNCHPSINHSLRSILTGPDLLPAAGHSPLDFGARRRFILPLWSSPPIRRSPNLHALLTASSHFHSTSTQRSALSIVLAFRRSPFVSLLPRSLSAASSCQLPSCPASQGQQDDIPPRDACASDETTPATTGDPSDKSSVWQAIPP